MSSTIMAIILIINSDESSGKTKTAYVAENKRDTCFNVGYMAEENRVQRFGCMGHG